MAKKNLDLNLLGKASKQYELTREVEIPVKIEDKVHMAVLKIDKVFSPSKIRDCVEEFVSRVDTFRKLNEDKLHEVMEAFLIFMLIKHFTSFPAPKEYKEQVAIINMLLETDLLYKIYAEFDINEIKKITDEVETVSITLEEKVGDYIKLAEELGFTGYDDKEEPTEELITK